MPFRLAAIISVALLQWFAATDLAEAQPHKGKIGGGGGFAFLTDPDVEHGRTASFGGFFGLRFNDNVSLEGGLYFVRSNRLFDEFGVVDETPTPAFRFETTRFHADGVLVLNIGRRQPFHPFVLFGAGVERRDNKQTDFTFEFEPDTDPPLPLPLPPELEVVLNETKYLPTAIVGGGAEIYFMYNLAARAEFRLWIPKDWGQRTQIIFFAATYYF